MKINCKICKRDLTSQAIKLLKGKIKEIKCNNCIYSNIKNIKL